MTDALRVGLVGVGWGALVHAPVFRAVDGYDLVALCSRRPDSVARAGEKLGITDISTDWETFVARDDLDLISISPPVPYHHDMFLAAVAAGKHVLCEKPLAMSGEQGRAMTEAAEGSDRATLVCFENRWSPEHLAIRELVADGALGLTSFVQVTITTGYWHRPTRRSPPGCTGGRRAGATCSARCRTRSTSCSPCSAGRWRCAPTSATRCRRSRLRRATSRSPRTTRRR